MPAASHADPVLVLTGIRQEIAGRLVLDLPELTAAAGEHTLMLGPSGSGKTTLLHIIAGILRPTAGRVVVAGHDFAGMGAAAIDALRGRQIGIVFQTLHLIGALTVRQNLRLARSLAGLPADDDRIAAVLADLHIGHLADKRPGALSQGEAQRAAIARAVINAPALILADEPTSALDDDNCAAVMGLLQQQAGRSGATLLVATHDARLSRHFERQLRLEARP